MSSFRLAIPSFLPLVVGLAFLTGACGAPLVVTGAGYAADGSLLAASNKTASDHLASMISKKDCALWRAFWGRPICKEREGDRDPYNVDYTQPQRMVSEDGVQYAPPLRAAPGAPATSWDAAAYKAAPAPVPVAPAVPVTALADATPDPATAAPPKPKKVKARSAKKPSRDRAAPAF
jgi:hypothetical protein